MLLISHALLLPLSIMTVQQINELSELSLCSAYGADTLARICVMLQSIQCRPAVVICMRSKDPCNTNDTLTSLINY